MVVGNDLVLFPREPLPTETVGVTVTREDEDMTAAAANPEQSATSSAELGALSRLVQDANDAGISYQAMADRGREPDGKQYPKQWYQKLVKTPPVGAPSVPQMHAIATATNKTFRAVQLAVAEQWLQYEATELSRLDPEVRIIVGHLANKTPDELRRWRYMIEADERAQREGE